jgi:RNA polymerase sigma-70 factor (ECF subfamily)
MEHLPAQEDLTAAGGSRFAAYRPALLSYARCLVPSPADAEDLVQATLLAALENVGQLENLQDPRPWLFTILRNRFHRGARQREVVVTEEEWAHLAMDAGWAHSSPDPFSQVASIERNRQLETAFLALDSEDREILLLRDIEEMSGLETASLLGLTLAAMKSRLHRARLRLLTAMRQAQAGSANATTTTTSITASAMAHQTMTCLEVLQCLPHYADQSLPPQAKAAVEQHVAMCQACAHFGRRYADLLNALPKLSPDAAARANRASLAGPSS